MEDYSIDWFGEDFENRVEKEKEKVISAIQELKKTISEEADVWAIYINSDCNVDYTMAQSKKSSDFNAMVTLYQMDKVESKNGLLVLGVKNAGEEMS